MESESDDDLGHGLSRFSSRRNTPSVEHRRGKGRTVQAYAGVAVLQASPHPVLEMDSPPRLLPLPPRHMSAAKANYYPEVPRTTEDQEDVRGVYTQDQQNAFANNRKHLNNNMNFGKPGVHVPSDSAGSHPPPYPGYPGVEDSNWPAYAWTDSNFMGPNSAFMQKAMNGLTMSQQQAPQQQQSLVVHMSRTEAWSRFAAYEACIQVCCDNPKSEFAQHFQANGFRLLREHLRIGCLMLTPPSDADNPENANTTDICWRDGSATLAAALPDSDDEGGPCRKQLQPDSDVSVRVRVAGLLLPGTKVVDKLWKWGRRALVHENNGKDSKRKKLVVYVNNPDGSSLLQCPLEKNGVPLMDCAWSYLENRQGQLRVDVTSREGLQANGVVTAEQLWQAAQSLDIQEDNADTAWWGDADMGLGSGNGTGGSRTTNTIHVQMMPSNPNMAPMQLILDVQRARHGGAADLGPVLDEPGVSALRTSTLGFGTLQSDLGAPRGSKDQMMRLNRNIAYDCLLSAALDIEKCGPIRLTIEGPWQWLLTAYADQYNVSNAYRALVHLQWLLQPSIARTTQLCLSTIHGSWSYLVSCKQKGELTAQEDTMLTRIRRDVEELLKVAFVRYYVPQQDGDQEEEMPTRQYELQSWDAQHLQAAVQLYHQVAPFLASSARDWLATCWQTAAQKRWRALLAVGDPDRVLAGTDMGMESHGGDGMGQGMGQQAQAQSRRKAQSGLRSAGEVKVYQLVMSLCKLIQEDITFDLNLKHEPGLLPPEPELPKKTAEEYCAQFLLILRLVLETHPPSLPTQHAVELLTAVAKMQRYLDVAGLQCDVQHPGHLNAFQLFQPHVLRWISASQQRLTAQCQQLEANTKGQGGGLTQGGSNTSGLVMTMMRAVSGELRCYEQVLRHWPRFAQPLEAAVCHVLRGCLGALLRQCETAKGDAPQPAAAYPRNGQPAPQRHISPPTFTGNPTGIKSAGALSGGIPGVAGAPGHKRAVSSFATDISPRDIGPLMARAPAHARHASTIGPSMAVPDHPGAIRNGTAALNNRRWGGPPISPAPASAPRMVVLLKEAVLLNSLKHIMVMVPELEDDLTKWATWSAGQSPLSSEGQLLPDGVDIGVHFAQLVKELRSGYAEAVATCAGRMAEVLRGTPATNIRMALEPQRTDGPTQGHMPVSGAAAQKQALEEVLSPVLAGLHDALGALQAALDTRVCIATGRALWDYVGKDLHLFVSALHERNDDPSSGAATAWRARQNAAAAARRIDELFCQVFTELLNGAVQAVDLAPPAHMDKVHKLLQRNNAMINMAFIPF